MSMLTRLLQLSTLSLVLSLPVMTLASNTSENGGTLAGLFSQKSTPKFLPVHQAFKVSATQKGDVLMVSFKVTPEHYIYKDNLKLTLPSGVSMGAWTFDKPHAMIDDPEFGRVAVFEQDVVASVKLVAQTDVAAPISIRWQGCAKAGLCYPPETTKITVTLAGLKAGSGGVSATKTSDVSGIKDSSGSIAAIQPKNTTLHQNFASGDGIKDRPLTPSSSQATHQAMIASDSPTAAETAATMSNQATLSHQIEPSSTSTFNELAFGGAESDEKEFGLPDGQLAQAEAQMQNAESVTAVNKAMPNTINDGSNDIKHKALLSQKDPFGINENPVLAVLLLFLAGLLLSFTPCVYPMIPIVANIVAHNKSHSALRGFALSSSYGVGVASAYGILGGLIAWFGQAVGVIGLLQNPYVLGVFAIIFALLALYMFGVIKVTLPTGVRHFLSQKSQAADKRLGSVGGSYLVGALSALVVSPCVSAPMAGALTAVAVSGSVPFGFIALFSLGLGLSIPLMFIGLAQGKFMPKAGEWMNRVKEFCGLLLLAVSLSLLERLLSLPLMLIIWAVWFAMTAAWLFRIKNLASHAFALVSVIWSACLSVGAGAGATDPWRPLVVFKSSNNPVSNTDIKITTLSELDLILTSRDKVLVDVTADWCVECRIMERTLFTNRPAVLGDYQVVKLDVTQTNEDSRAVLARYGLFGPPALLIYKQGQLQTMLLGETKRADFEEALAAF